MCNILGTPLNTGDDVAKSIADFELQMALPGFERALPDQKLVTKAQ